ncbi:MAG: sensor histidine kinase, partial [Sulfuricella sp.]|nr:sensor histidine kinase [Sulfuricella sp.]
DEMGAVLAALHINVSLLAAKLPADMPQLKADADYLAKLVADGIQAMRQTVAELRPTELEDLGLEYVVENYVEEFRKNSGIACELRLPEEELSLDIKQSTALFRIVQESLANVAKHAGATKVNIALGAWGEAVVLTINDNGKGFNLNSRKSITFGLLGVIERAAMVGGKAEVSSAPGKGTTVRVSLPRPV